MKKNNILALVLVATLAYSCNVAKTCPTYAKAPNQSIEGTAKH